MVSKGALKKKTKKIFTVVAQVITIPTDKIPFSNLFPGFKPNLINFQNDLSILCHFKQKSILFNNDPFQHFVASAAFFQPPDGKFTNSLGLSLAGISSSPIKEGFSIRTLNFSRILCNFQKSLINRSKLLAFLLYNFAMFSKSSENPENRYHLILSSPSGPNWVRRTSTLLLSGASCSSKDLYFPSSGRHCEAHWAKKDLLLSCAVDII